jgi:hypothetical protein
MFVPTNGRRARSSESLPLLLLMRAGYTVKK